MFGGGKEWGRSGVAVYVGRSAVCMFSIQKLFQMYRAAEPSAFVSAGQLVDDHNMKDGQMPYPASVNAEQSYMMPGRAVSQNGQIPQNMTLQNSIDYGQLTGHQAFPLQRTAVLETNNGKTVNGATHLFSNHPNNLPNDVQLNSGTISNPLFANSRLVSPEISMLPAMTAFLTPTPIGITPSTPSFTENISALPYARTFPHIFPSSHPPLSEIVPSKPSMGIIPPSDLSITQRYFGTSADNVTSEAGNALKHPTFGSLIRPVQKPTDSGGPQMSLPPQIPGIYNSPSSLGLPSIPGTPSINCGTGDARMARPSMHGETAGITAPGLYQQKSRLDPNLMPSVVQVIEEDRSTRSGTFPTGYPTAEHPPLTSTEFVAQDQGICNPKFMRSTLYVAPASSDMLKSSRIPFAVAVTPFARLHSNEFTSV